jgi:hypothetical protein
VTGCGGAAGPDASAELVGVEAGLRGAPGTSVACATGLFSRNVSVAFVPSTAVTLRVSSTTFSGLFV